MSDFLIEVLTHLDPLLIGNQLPKWKLFNRTDNMQEAREIAAKAILKTNYLAVRIRQKS